MNSPIRKLDPKQHVWLQNKALQRIFNTIKQDGGEARAVGGAVRDSLIGRDVKEIDLAVNRDPQWVMECLTKAGIKTIPTGIEHGTITAVIDATGYEITTLRRDVKTDGRHATVAFTDDWEVDALRRDFTINALYVDTDGIIFDYTNGRKDLADGRVRFIGNAQTRIQEDALRILRFFRFTAWFAVGPADAEGLAACRDLAALIPQLSVERVWREIIKLLAAADPVSSWQLMLENNVLTHILPQAHNIVGLKSLLAVEKKYEGAPQPLIRLASLLPRDTKVVTEIAKRLKLSNRETEKMTVLATLPERLQGKLDPIPFGRVLYEYGAHDTQDALLLLAIASPASDIDAPLAAASVWEKPNFPIQGADILKLGIPAGPKVGTLLRAIEEWWIANDFRPTRDECLAEAKKLF